MKGSTMNTPDTHTRRNTLIYIIRRVLGTADRPLTSVEVAQHPDMAAVNAHSEETSRILWQLVARKKKYYPVARIPYDGPGAPQWEYYDPTRITPLKVEKDEPEQPVVEPQDEPETYTLSAELSGFEFNPVQFAPEPPAPPAQAAQPEPKTITIEVPGGITVTIAF